MLFLMLQVVHLQTITHGGSVLLEVLEQVGIHVMVNMDTLQEFCLVLEWQILSPLIEVSARPHHPPVKL
ncbi:MAG TPA: hypothetical protein DCZ00_01520 [Lactococcus sp.]|nr:hypothetical protein [Lactococcus sp.]